MVVLQVGILLVLTAVGIISTLGSLTRPKPRQANVFLLHILLLLFLVELGWLAFSTYVAGGADLNSASSCSVYRRIVKLFYIAVGTSWFISLLFFIFFFINLDPCGCCTVVGAVERIESHEEGRRVRYNRLQQMQLGRHSCLTCCKTERNPYKASALNDFVKILGVLFGDFDITFSDLTAGLLLSGYYQHQLYKKGKSPTDELRKATVKLLRENGSVSSTYDTPKSTPLTEDEVQELSAQCRAYIVYTLASYTGITCYSDTPCRATLTQCRAARGCICYPYCRSRRFEGDGLVANASVLSTTLGIPQSDIVTASFVNSVYELPYFVVNDPIKKELVVTIRGTFSIHDALTDFSVAFVKFPEGLLGVENAFLHQGFHTSAKVIYKKLMENEDFIDVLSRNKFEKFLFTGHSLGAAVAAVLAIMFKEEHKNKPYVSKIEAFLFATPGAVMNYSLAEKTKEFMTTVVASNDVVPRASVRAFGYLRLLIEVMLTTVDSSKNRVICCAGHSWWQCCPPRVPQEEDVVGLEELTRQSTPESCDNEDDYERFKTYLPFTVLNPNRSQTNEHASHLIRSIRECMGGALEPQKQPLMFMPGRILHLEEPDQYSTCSGLEDVRVTSSWKAREALSGIFVHPDMIGDHLPDRYESHIKRFGN